jgi:hypothetical protein
MHHYKNNKALFIFLFVIFFLQNIFAQKNYVEGHIVTFENDTLSGFIDYRNWKKNPKFISFRKMKKSATIVYSPKEIKEFEVGAEIYISTSVKIGTDPIKLKELSNNKEFSFTYEMVFLQTLIKGDKGLYLFRNKIKSQFYIFENGSYKLLEYKQYIVNTEGEKLLRENKTYLSQLGQYLTDCASLQRTLKDTKYTIKSLENLFEFYYDCSSSVVEFQIKSKKPIYHIGLVAGGSMSILRFKRRDKYPTFRENINLPPSYNFTGGGFLEVVFPRNFQKWSSYSELLYTQYNIAFEEIETISISRLYFDMSYIRLNNMVRYHYHLNDLKLFVNGGISFGVTVKHNSYRSSESKVVPTIGEVTSTNPTPKGTLIEFGGLAGVGLKLNKFSAELRYEKGDESQSFALLRLPSHRFFFIIGYHF